MSHNSTDRPTTRRARRSQDRLLEQERQAQEQGRYNDDGHYYAPLHAGEQPDAHGDDSPGHGQQYGNRDVDHSGNGHYEDGQYVDAHAVDGHYVDGRYVDGHYADAHVADGRFVDAAYADGHHADGHYDNGHYADGHEPVQFDEAGHPVFSPRRQTPAVGSAEPPSACAGDAVPW